MAYFSTVLKCRLCTLESLVFLVSSNIFRPFLQEFSMLWLKWWLTPLENCKFFNYVKLFFVYSRQPCFLSKTLSSNISRPFFLEEKPNLWLKWWVNSFENCKFFDHVKNWCPLCTLESLVFFAKHYPAIYVDLF